MWRLYLPLNRYVPLRCLPIAEQRIVSLFETASAVKDGLGSRSGLRELDLRRLQHAACAIGGIYVCYQVR